MTTSKSYIGSLSIINWNGREPSGAFTFYYDGGSMNHQLDKEDCERIFAVAHEIIHRKRGEIAREIEKIEPPALLGYDRKRTIDASEVETPPSRNIEDEIPF